MDEGLVQIIEAVKGEAEAKSEEIVKAGKAKAQSVVDAAHKEAEGIVATAKRDAERAHTEMTSQLRLAARDFILLIKGELEDLLALTPCRQGVSADMADPDFLKKLVVAMVTEYGKGEGAGRGDMTITVPTSMLDEMSVQLRAMLSKVLQGGHPLLEASDRLEGFTFSVGGSGEVTVTPDAIVEAIKPFVLDKFHEILEGAAKDAAK